MLAAYLRLANLPDNPGWYTDEGTHLDIAQNLLRGRTQYLALTQSTLLVARMPLFEMLLVGVMRLSGNEGIGALRALTGGLGVLSTALLSLSSTSGRGRSCSRLARLRYTVTRLWMSNLADWMSKLAG